ncbi:MAG: oligosaccharide flippase family protein, partial [Thiohalomonadales bacterium]
MKKGKSILANVYWLSSSNLITKLIWILCTLILMRELGPEGYGLFVLMLSAATLAAPFTDLGISLALTRDGARNPNIIRHYVSLVFRIKILLSLLLWIILSAVYYNTTDLGPYAQGYWGLVLVVAILGVPLIDHFHTVMTSVLQINQRLDIFSKYRIAMFVGVLSLFVWLPYLNHNKLLYVALVYFGMTLLFVLFYLRKTTNFIPAHEGESPPFNTVVASGSSFLILVLLSLALFRVDVIVISIFGSIDQAGIYGAFYQGVFLFFMVASVLFSVLFP